MYKVYFENKQWVYMTEKQLELHRRMQDVYHDMYRIRDKKEQELHARMEASAIDITDECIRELEEFLKTLTPTFDMCMRYNEMSLCPRLSVKITKIENI